MTRLALRGLLARKLRTFLTGLAVVLGVAFVAGTFVFTDTLDASFKDLFERASKGADVTITAREEVDDPFNLPQPFSAEILDRVRAAEGVDDADGFLNATAVMFDQQGERIGTQSGPALLVTATEERFNPLTYDDGGPPETPDQVAIDAKTADDHGFEVGDRIQVASEAPAKRYEIAGIARLGDASSLGGLGFVEMTLAEGQRVSDREGRLDEISVAAADGVTPEQLKATLVREVGREVEVRTGAEAAEQRAAEIGDQLGFLQTALLVFAGVALIVGAFLIFNTFSITVAQRTREFALLRTLGASRRQILSAVVLEATLIGLGASVIGVLAGIALAPGLASLLASFGLDLPATETVIAPRTIVAGLLVGTLATVLAGFIPARRATRVEPVTAMRESEAPTVGRFSRRRALTAAAIIALGVVALVAGLFGDVGSASSTASLLGLGALAVVVGVAVLAPLLVRPLARVLGAPLQRLQGLTGRLARENAERQPQRTAITAAALMVGLALVVFVSIFAAGLRATIDTAVDEQFRGELVVASEDGFTPIPGGAAERLRSVPDAAAVTAVRFQSGQVAGVDGTTATSGIDPATASQVLRIGVAEGPRDAVQQLTPRQAILDEEWAREQGLRVGSTVRMTTPTGARVPYEVAALLDSDLNQLGFLGDVVVSNASMAQDWNVRQDAIVVVDAQPGVSPEQLKREAEPALAAFPVAVPQTIEEYKDEQSAQVDQLLGLIFALLSLSVIVSLLGIINTLALAVHERTRELGLLRAVGMSRRQVRRMVRGEAVITAGIGAVLGLVLGVAFAALVSRPLAEDGFRLAIPWLTLVVLAILAAVAGVLAAIAPARRASRVDVLRAVTTE